MENNIGKWNSGVPVEKSSYIREDEYIIINAPITIESQKFTMIDLFCGAGGFSVGAKWAGFESVAGIDYLKPAIETWAFNHPNAVSILGDIRKIEPRELKNLIGNIKIDVITAGVPCQGFSLANRKHNTEDSRNYLFLEAIKFFDYFKPSAVIIENVSAIRSRGNGKFEKAILAELEKIGYTSTVKTLNAASFGVPQLRERAFFVGIKGDRSFNFPKGMFKDISENTVIKGETYYPYRTVKDAIYDLPKINSHGRSNEYVDGIELCEYQKLMRYNNCSTGEILSNHIAPKHDVSTIERIENTQQGKHMYDKFKQRIRLDYNRPSPTQLAGGIRPQFQFGHPELARGLTIRERARIQSFPDNYVFKGSVVQERIQTGNAVPPLMAYEVLKQLTEYLRG